MVASMPTGESEVCSRHSEEKSPRDDPSARKEKPPVVVFPGDVVAGMGKPAKNTPLTGINSMTPPSRFRVPIDVRALCRLTALHSRNPVESSTVRFTVDDHAFVWRVLNSVHIGRNVRCLVFAREKGNLQCECLDKSLSFNATEIVFAFNWFSPKAIWDFVSLGLQLSHHHSIEEVFGMCNSVSFEHAQTFLQDQPLRELVMQLKLGFIPAKINREASDSASLGLHADLIHCRRITLTGFSMGGTTAHAMAVLLKEVHQVPQEIQVVGMGSPRPGNERLSEWFEENLTRDSMNIVMYLLREDDLSVYGTTKRETAPICRGPVCRDDLLPAFPPVAVKVYDPATIGPSCARGFAVHPALHIMKKGGGGWLQRISTQERERLRFADLQGISPNPPEEEASGIGIKLLGLERMNGRAHDDIHSVQKYYEEMVGLTE